MRLAILVFLAPMLLGAKPIDVNEINRLGVEATRRGDHIQAVDFFRQAQALEPEQPVLRFNLFNALNNAAVAHARAGEVDAAIEACSQALELIPHDVRVASNLAIFFHNHAVELLGRNEFEAAREAVGNARKVVERFRLDNLAPMVRSTHARIYLVEARSWFRRNEVGKALDLYGECLAINPEEAYAYLDRSRIYYDQNSFQDAASDLELAIQILGETPELAQLLKRLALEAEEKGQAVSDQDAFFVFQSAGLSPPDNQALRRLAKETRLRVTRDLAVNPKTPITIEIDANAPLVRTAEWMSLPGQALEPERIRLGVAGASIDGEDFKRAFQFHYLATLTKNIAGESAPYWFAVGMGFYFLDGGIRLTPRETEELLEAGENFLLLPIEEITSANMALIEDSRQIHLANLQCKALVEHLVNAIRVSGVRQLMGAIRDGSPFDQALADVGNLKPADLDREWRNFMGLPER